MDKPKTVSEHIRGIFVSGDKIQSETVALSKSKGFRDPLTLASGRATDAKNRVNSAEDLDSALQKIPVV
jgi:hypothetical protein